MRIKKIFISIVTILLVLFFSKYSSKAMPAFSQWENYKSNNGQTLKLKLCGDEKLNYYKTTANEVLIRGEDSNFYYASFKDGSLVNSQVKFGASYNDKLTEDKLFILKSNYLHEEAKQYNSIYNLMDFKGIEYPNIGSSRPVLVVLVEFNDKKLTYDENQWYNEFFGQTTGTVYDYYDKASKGKFHFSPAKESYGVVNDGIIKISLDSDHPNFRNGFYDGKEASLTQSAMNGVNQYVNFVDFDLNNDGKVSADEISINIIVAGYESSCGSKAPSVWGHESSYYIYGDGKSVQINYTMQGEIHEIGGDHRATIGIFCHELGHALGLPDLYDYDGSSDGVGMHSIMAGGSWGTVNNGGDSPTRFDPWSMYFLGFATPITISSSSDYIVNSNWNDYNIYKINTGDPNQYYLIENRELNGYDASLKGSIKSGGIGIYHIDESVLQNSFYGPNNDENHKAVDVEEANEGRLGFSELDKRSFIDGDHFFYQSGNDTFSQSTVPNSNLYNKTATGIELYVKSSPATTMNISAILPGSQYESGSIEKPIEGESIKGTYDITGYYFSNSFIQKILVYLDGNEAVMPLDVNMWRREINDKYGNVGDWGNKRTGFKGTLDTTKYSDGSHILSLQILLSNGKTIDLGSRNINISNTENNNLSLSKISKNISINGLVFDGIKYVTINTEGDIYTSADKSNWSLAIHKDEFKGMKLAYGNGQYILASYDGKLYYSTDLVNWLNSTLQMNSYSTDFQFYFLNNKFIYINYHNIYVSNDGKNFLLKYNGDTWSEDKILYDNGEYILYNNSEVLTSIDALSWNQVDIKSKVSGDIKDIKYYNGKFIILTANNIYISPSIVNFVIENTFPLNNLSFTPESVFYNNGNYYLINSSYNKNYCSSDMINWIEQNTNFNFINNSMTNIEKINNLFIAYGYDGLIASTADFKNWTPIYGRVQGDFIKYLSYNNDIIGLSKDGTVTFLNNNTKLNRINLEDYDEIEDYAIYGNKIIAISKYGKVYSSTDAYTWNSINLVEYGYDSSPCITFGKNVFALKYDNMLYLSSDGVKWNIEKTDDNIKNITKVFFTNNNFYGTSDTYSFCSPDGINWSMKNASTNSFFKDIIYNKGIFIGNDSSNLYYSTDCANWTQINGINNLENINVINDKFIAIAQDQIYLSSDGVNWVIKSLSNIANVATSYIQDSKNLLLFYSNGDVCKLSSNLMLMSTSNSIMNVTDCISLKFNNAIRSIDTSKIKLQVKGNSAYFSCYIYGNELIIKPDNYLKGNSSYKLTLDSTAFIDSNGQTLSQGLSFDFNTLNPTITSQDLNGDGIIDIKDLALISKTYNSKSKDTLFNYNYDLNFDEIIDIFDLVNLSKKL